MIRDYEGNRTTPKRLAEDMLMDVISTKMEFFGEDSILQDLTLKERGKVYSQAHKIALRMANSLHQGDNFLWS